MSSPTESPNTTSVADTGVGLLGRLAHWRRSTPLRDGCDPRCLAVGHTMLTHAAAGLNLSHRHPPVHRRR